MHVIFKNIFTKKNTEHYRITLMQLLNISFKDTFQSIWLIRKWFDSFLLLLLFVESISFLNSLKWNSQLPKDLAYIRALFKTPGNGNISTSQNAKPHTHLITQPHPAAKTCSRGHFSTPFVAKACARQHSLVSQSVSEHSKHWETFIDLPQGTPISLRATLRCCNGDGLARTQHPTCDAH